MANVFIQVLGIEQRRVNDFDYKNMEIDLYYDDIDTGDYPELADPPTFTDLVSAFNYFGDYGWTLVKRELELRQRKILHRYWMGKGPTVPTLGPDGSFLGEYATSAALEAAHEIANVGDCAVVGTPEPSLYYFNGSSWVQSSLSLNNEGKYLGVYADLTALQTAHPTANDGDTATVVAPNNNLYYWDGAAWTDTGTGYLGDMLKSLYDPTNVEGDAFDMDNMVQGTTNKFLSGTDYTDLTDAGDSALHYHSTDRDRANHTGTQTHETISDYDTELAGTTNVTAFTPTADYHPATKKYIDDLLDLPSGGGYFITPVTTSFLINEEDTPRKVDATFTVWNGENKIVWNGTSKRFEFSGDDGTILTVALTNSGTLDKNGAVLTYHIAKNGTPITGLARPRTIANAGQYAAMGLVGKFSIDDGDYIELYVEQTSAIATDVTTKDVQLIFSA